MSDQPRPADPAAHNAADIESGDELVILEAGTEVGELVRLADEAASPDVNVDPTAGPAADGAHLGRNRRLIREASPERWNSVELRPRDIVGRPAIAEHRGRPNPSGKPG